MLWSSWVRVSVELWADMLVGDVYLLYEHGWLPSGPRGGLCWRVDHAFVPTKLSLCTQDCNKPCYWRGRPIPQLQSSFPSPHAKHSPNERTRLTHDSLLSPPLSPPSSPSSPYRRHPPLSASGMPLPAGVCLSTRQRPPPRGAVGRRRSPARRLPRLGWRELPRSLPRECAG